MLRDGGLHAVLLRRHPERSDEVACYLVYAPVVTPPAEVVRATGARWTIEDSFTLATGQVRLDHYEARSWQGWDTALAVSVPTEPNVRTDGAECPCSSTMARWPWRGRLI